MRVEIVGVGEVEIFPIKAQENKVVPMTKDGKNLIKVSAKKVESESGYFVDDSGNKYSEEQVFYEFGGLEKPVQRIKRTEKVSKFSNEEKSAYTDLADDVGTSVLKCNATTRENFKAKVGDGSIKFQIKKADRGWKFYNAYAYTEGDKILMRTGRGSVKKGIEQFDKLEMVGGKQGIKQDLVEVSADEIEIEV